MFGDHIVGTMMFATQHSNEEHSDIKTSPKRGTFDKRCRVNLLFRLCFVALSFRSMCHVHDGLFPLLGSRTRSNSCYWRALRVVDSTAESRLCDNICLDPQPLQVNVKIICTKPDTTCQNIPRIHLEQMPHANLQWQSEYPKGSANKIATFHSAENK